jgi:hypothetical protein
MEDDPMSVNLKGLMAIEKAKYLEQCAGKGGTAQGFRNRIEKQYEKDPRVFKSLLLEALFEAATKKWQAQPRKSGPDLFAFAGVAVPDVLTRPRAAYVNGDEIDEDEEQKFEKVDSRFATVNDYREDAMIKIRKGRTIFRCCRKGNARGCSPSSVRCRPDMDLPSGLQAIMLAE